ncbi:hypothetical protein ACF1BE_02380 [Streptomyces sp. NPDC014991]
MSRAARETTLQLDAWPRTYDVDVVLRAAPARTRSGARAGSRARTG